MEVFRRVMERIGREQLKRLRQCEWCGPILVRNRQERKEIKTLVGTVRVNWVFLRSWQCRQDRYVGWVWELGSGNLGVGKEGYCGSVIGISLRGKGREIVQRLMVEISRSNGVVERRDRVRELMGYVRGNLDWIANIVKVGCMEEVCGRDGG